MAKDIEEIDDKGTVENASIPEAPEDNSVRGAIRAALSESKDEPEAKEPVDKDPPKRERRTKEVEEDTLEKEIKEPTSDDKNLETKPEDKPEPKLKAPPGWTKEGKTHWDTLPPDVQKSVIKREEEVSNGIKQYADKARAFDEYESVINPYRQQIQAFGVTPVQTINRLFQWMSLLAQPDQTRKIETLKELAKSFGADITQLGAVRADYDSNNQQQNTNQNDVQPPAWAQSIAQEVNNLKVQTQQRAAQQAEQFIMNWAKDKPHFDKVRNSMKNLIDTGEVPLKNGELDLDGAYAKAVRLNDEVWAQIQQEADEKAQAEAKAKADKEAKEKAERLKKAKNAGIGIKPSAPSLNAAPIGKAKPNGAGTKTSVRDSLKASMQQLREDA